MEMPNAVFVSTKGECRIYVNWPDIVIYQFTPLINIRGMRFVE